MTIEQPDHGGRVRFELRDEDELGASYGVTLFTQEGRWDAVARLDVSPGAAAPQCGDWAASEGATQPAPAWLARYAGSMLAVLQRDHREAPGARWPRRVLRWRAERA